MKALLSLIIICFSLNTAYAGDFVKAGDVVSEDSYVFNIEEATGLMNKLTDLEQENLRLNALVEEYKKLDNIQQSQEFNFESLIEIKELQITEYEKLHALDTNRIKQLNRQVNSSKFEKWAFMGLGVGVTIGAILVADKIDDNIESIENSKAQLAGLTLLRF